MPTGGGKTILFADVIRRVFPRRALVLAHREELIFQARDKIQRVTGLRADVEMGEYQAEGGLFDAARVIVSTIQTQCSGGDGGGRMAKFDPQQFGVLSRARSEATRSFRTGTFWPPARSSGCSLGTAGFCRSPQLGDFGMEAESL